MARGIKTYIYILPGAYAGVGGGVGGGYPPPPPPFGIFLFSFFYLVFN